MGLQQSYVFKKTQHFKCYLTMSIANTADPHWFWYGRGWG